MDLYYVSVPDCTVLCDWDCCRLCGSESAAVVREKVSVFIAHCGSSSGSNMSRIHSHLIDKPSFLAFAIALAVSNYPLYIYYIDTNYLLPPYSTQNSSF